jgi:signal transduction histidine kinase
LGRTDQRLPARSAGAFGATLWRALAGYRVLTFCYLLVRFVQDADGYARPALATATVALLAVWSAATVLAYRRPAGRRWPVVGADLAVAVGAVLVSPPLQGPAMIAAGHSTLPTIWSASAVLACAIRGGWRGGVLGGLLVGLADLGERGAITSTVLHNAVLLLVAGGVIGYTGQLALGAERQLAHALRIEAATRERERLARDIHDSVLQVLALVGRRGAEIGGAAAELGALAAEQEVALRALVASGGDGQDRTPTRGSLRGEEAEQDLRALLASYASGAVTLSAPSTPVPLPVHAAREIAAAVGAALDNVRQHAGTGAHAWVLVEDAGAQVVVSVRDDGPGLEPGRLESAAAEGRLGVAQSISGRLRDLGGAATVLSVPGQGTEVELRVPRHRP